MRRGCRVPLAGLALGQAEPDAPEPEGPPPLKGEAPPMEFPPWEPDPNAPPRFQASGTTPGAAGFRPGNWDFEQSEYTIAQGDTLWGLATQYLGQGGRWLEIWQLQTKPWGTTNAAGAPYLNRYHNKVDPSSKNPGRGIMEGDVLIMPKTAVENAKKMAASDIVQPLPTTPGAPGWQPGGGRPQVKPQAMESGFSTTHLILGGVALIGLLALSR